MFRKSDEKQSPGPGHDSQANQPRPATPDAQPAEGAPRPDGWRETVESIVVAFVLAFLFRTFEAEAFVIPTGSMAPTLYGQHRDIYCAQCGTRFAVGASSGTAQDAEIRTEPLQPDTRPVTFISPSERTHFAVCPNGNCRFPNDVLDREIFAGDRILVNKFPYEFGEPERFDVIVFKFPEGAKTNYIKRLIGLPGEELRLVNGDVRVRKLGADLEPFRIARKDPEKQRRIQLLVHDNDRPAKDLLAAGWPEAWQGADRSAWSADTQARAFRVDPDPLEPDAEHWLRYTNYVPTADDWTKVLAGQPLASTPQPQPVHDFYAYNSKIMVQDARFAVSQGRLPELSLREHGAPEWVGDLTLSAAIEVLEPAGELTLELVEGARRYQCRIDLKTGLGGFSFQPERSPEGEPLRRAGDEFQTDMGARGEYDVSFANVDDRLCVWVDDRLVGEFTFDEDKPGFQPPSQPVSPLARDRAPVGIAARGAKLRVSRLKVERDIFYRNETPGGHPERIDGYKLRDSDDDSLDEFLMLGDNSPRSNDSRLWPNTHAVQRRLLIGKAFFIYWPHGVPFLNDGRGLALGKYREPPRGENVEVPLPKMSIPFYPQYERWRRIR